MSNTVYETEVMLQNSECDEVCSHYLLLNSRQTSTLSISQLQMYEFRVPSRERDNLEYY